MQSPHSKHADATADRKVRAKRQVAEFWQEACYAREKLEGSEGGRSSSTTTGKHQTSLSPNKVAMKSRCRFEEVSETAKAPLPKRNIAGRIISRAPPLPSKALAIIVEDSSTIDSSKTPTLTPHTLTDNALRKSELLLAELTALGLSDEDELENKHVHSSGEDKFCLKCGESSLSADSIFLPIHYGHKFADTVEVPVVLLDLFSETLAKCHSSQSLTQCSSEFETQTPEPEPEAKTSSVEDLNNADGTITPSTCLSSPPRSTSPHVSPRVSVRQVDTLGPPRSVRRAASPKISVQRQHSGIASQFQKASQVAKASVQVCQQVSTVSPQIQSVPVQITLPVQTPRGCKSYTIQHTVTVTSTITFN